MSIIQAMFAGSSALTNFGEAMTVIGNNLANANTTAFKASSSSFEDVLIQTVGGGQGNGASTQIGTGVGLADVRQNMVQGSFSQSANVTDLSIDGRGFFQVRDRTLATDEKLDQSGRPKDLFYTRAGGFTKNKEHLLVSSGGMVLQGWGLDDEGSTVDNPKDIDLSNYYIQGIKPTPTSLVTLGVNLDSTTTALPQTVPYNPEDSATFDHETSVRVFDSGGAGHDVRIQFRKAPMRVRATATTSNANLATKVVKFDLNLTDAQKAAGVKEDAVTVTLKPDKVGGTPLVSDSIPLPAGSQVLDLSKLTIGGKPLTDSLDATTGYQTQMKAAGGGTTTNMSGFGVFTLKFTLGLSDTLKAAKATSDQVTLTLTPVTGGTPLVADPITMKSGSQEVNLASLTSGGKPLALDPNTRYQIDYKTTGNSNIDNLVGTDSIPEIKGVDNDGTWEWHAVVENDQLDLSQRGANSNSLTALDLNSKNFETAAPGGVDYTQGKLIFNEKGQLQKEGSTPITLKFMGADSQQILFNFGDAVGNYGDSTNDFSMGAKSTLYEATPIPDVGNTGGNGCHQSTSPFSLLRLEQNGFPSGTLDKLAINEAGVVSGNFTNGQSKDLYQITIYDFDDEYSLEQVGSNLFNETNASGKARKNFAGTGSLGNIISYSLEQSNVDMSAEFVRMITTQRGFQANSRIVTVTDGMLEELLALKR